MVLFLLLKVGDIMAVSIKRDLFKYKQSPYYEPVTKTERKSIQRALRHYIKQAISNVLN